MSDAIEKEEYIAAIKPIIKCHLQFENGINLEYEHEYVDWQTILG